MPSIGSIIHVGLFVRMLFFPALADSSPIKLSHENVTFYSFLYNNQINAHALIGQSAVDYGAGKPTEKIAGLLNYYIKAIDHKFLRVIG